MSINEFQDISVTIQFIDRSTTDTDGGAIEVITTIATGVMFTIRRINLLDTTTNTPQTFRQTIPYRVRTTSSSGANLSIQHQLVWTDLASSVTHTARITTPMTWKGEISPGWWTGWAEEAITI